MLPSQRLEISVAANIPTNYVIMKKILMMAAAAMMLFSCQNDDATDSSFAMKASGADYAACSLPVQTVSGDITANTTWTNDKVWEIDGVVRVKNGATLTIQAGTFIKAVNHVVDTPEGILVITKTGKIDAQGTEESPIVFTSYNLLDCDAATTATPGDFGGIVLLGDAEINTGSVTNVIEGLGDQPNVEDFYFGGSNNAHNAGIMKYVRIEFAGRILNAATGVEVNGLTFGAVGNGTVIDHIQVSYGRDDSYEFFGGKVSPSYLVSLACDDDNFDFDNGYTGSITRAIAVADKNSTHSKSGGNPDSNGIELDNNASGTVTTLITRPVISFMSIYGLQNCADGNLLENAVHVRRAGRIALTNSLVSGYNTGIFVETPSTTASPTLFSNVNVDAFVTVSNPAGITGVTGVAACGTADAFGASQPWYNNGTLSFTTSPSRTNGAFAGGVAIWTNNWTKFSGF